MLNRFRITATVAALACMAGTASAQAVITNGTIRMGVRALGDLNTGSVPQIAGTSIVGLRLITAAGDYEATADGCTCEGWGVGVRNAAGTVTSSGYANSAVGTANLTGVSFTSTATTATSVTRLTSGAGIEVTHLYRPSAETPNMYEVIVSIKNTGATTLNDIVYRRVMDWDIRPTNTIENVRISGWGAANLIGSGSNGFNSADPLTGGSGTDCLSEGKGACNANFETTVPGDIGAFFDFSFGALTAGSTKTFTTFYGAAPTYSALLTALGAVGAEVYSAGWCGGGSPGSSPTSCNGKSGPAVFGYGFKGVGGAPPPELPPAPGVVPEPSTYALMGTGLMALAMYSRRRRTNG